MNIDTKKIKKKSQKIKKIIIYIEFGFLKNILYNFIIIITKLEFNRMKINKYSKPINF